MTQHEIWEEYCEKYDIDKSISYEAWQFGDRADELAELVCMGIKTATCSQAAVYEFEPDEPEPKVDDISIILNSADEAVCIIRNIKVYTAPFCDITAEHAFKEGEGDRSSSYWRQVHKNFFRKEAEEYGISFHENSNVICEEFEVLYRA